MIVNLTISRFVFQSFFVLFFFFLIVFAQSAHTQASNSSQTEVEWKKSDLKPEVMSKGKP